MQKTTRLKRLNELYKMLKNHDKLFKTVKFDIDTWAQTNSDDKPITKCSTAACALGSAGLHEPFRKLGLKTDHGAFGQTEVGYKGREDFGAGMSFFGISWEESGWLFDPSSYYSPQYQDRIVSSDKVKADVVAARVKKLIKHYEKYNFPLINGDAEYLPFEYRVMGLAA